MSKGCITNCSDGMPISPEGVQFPVASSLHPFWSILGEMPCGHLSAIFRQWSIGSINVYRGNPSTLTGWHKAHTMLCRRCCSNVTPRAHLVYKGCGCSLHSLTFLQHCQTSTQPITCSCCSKWQLHCLLLCWSLHEGFSGSADYYVCLYCIKLGTR